MTHKTAAKFNIAELAFEVKAGSNGAAPSEVHMLPVGPFRAVDGRPEECDAWQLDADIAARLIALAASRKTDILIDFEHQSLRSKDNGKPAPAAGWIPRTLEWRDGAGLYGVSVDWVGDTAALIAAKKYRYISSVFAYDADTGEVLEIISVALTNTPALDGLEALADLARRHSALSTASTAKEADMPDPQVAALTVERDGLKSQVAALTTANTDLTNKVAALTKERDDNKAEADALKKEKADAAAAKEKADHATLLEAALSDGRLAPAQKPWAEKQSFAALTEYLDATKPLAILGKQSGKDKGEGAHGLIQEELDMCSKMGVSPEDYAKTKGKC